jgi:hypothetical protein
MASSKFVILSAVCAVSLMNGIAQAAPGNADGRAGSWRSAAQGAPSLKAAQKAVEKNPQDAVWVGRIAKMATLLKPKNICAKRLN